MTTENKDGIDVSALKAAVNTEVETPEIEATQEVAEVATEPTPSQVRETEARTRGWVPKDEWKGDPDEWRPAKEFLDRGELIGKIMALNRETDQLKAAVNHMTQQQQKAYIEGFQTAIAQMKARREEALEEGDLKQAQRITDKIDEIKDAERVARQQVATQTAQAAAESSTFKAWHQANPWYQKDRTLTLFAESVGVAFKESNPRSSEAEMLYAVEKEVKQEFQHKFKPRQAAPNPDGEGRQARGSQTQRQQLGAAESAMTSEQRDIMKTILRVTPGLTKEQYLKDFNKK